MKIPQKPQEIFSEYTADYMGIFGESLLSVILYGSGSGDDYHPGKSDLNFLVIVDEIGIERLGKAIPIVKKWKAGRVAAPLIMTRSELSSSLDSYPIEFLNMKNHYALVYGQDVLQSLIFEPAALRLQIERELKGKLFLLRKSYLESEGRESALRNVIGRSLTAVTAVFGALLFLKGREIPSTRRGVIKAMAWAFPIKPDVFLQCAEIREGEGHYIASELESLLNDCIKEISKLCELIDQV